MECLQNSGSVIGFRCKPRMHTSCARYKRESMWSKRRVLMQVAPCFQPDTKSKAVRPRRETADTHPSAETTEAEMVGEVGWQFRAIDLLNSEERRSEDQSCSRITRTFDDKHQPKRLSHETRRRQMRVSVRKIIIKDDEKRRQRRRYPSSWKTSD